MSHPSLIPLINPPASACLTPENWQAVGVTTACCQLESLLIKPGLALLQSLPNLQRWFGWSGALWLNLELPEAVAGQIKLISPYDGQRLQLDLGQIGQLVQSWPDIHCILPQRNRAFWQSLDLHWSDTIPECTDVPAAQGLAGFFITASGYESISAEEFSNAFTPLAADCSCPVCTQGLTRAYLHHLYAHTPLLAQRFLVQHNIFCMS